MSGKSLGSGPKLNQAAYQKIILRKLRSRSREKTMCPSEVLASTDKQNKALMEDVRKAARDLRKNPDDYRVGIGEKGVLTFEPYKSEILPHWRFKTQQEAERSAKKIFAMFKAYERDEDFVGMDMARKFIQMGGTRARRYANHPSGRKYSCDGEILPLANDPEKAASAQIFFRYLKRIEGSQPYADLKIFWRAAFG